MENLAGKVEPALVKIELRRAGIPIKRHPTVPSGEVCTRVYGAIGNLTFHRCLKHWLVEGPVPLIVANEMFSTKIGHVDLRVQGGSSGSAPTSWALPDPLKMTAAELDLARGKDIGAVVELCATGKIKAPRYVHVYHIDTQTGLNYFVQTLRRHRLA